MSRLLHAVSIGSMTRFLLLTALLLVGLTNGGCSVALAMASPDGPDRSIVCAGSCRRVVEHQLGSPCRTGPGGKPGETIAVYCYRGLPTTKAKRVAAHVIGDILTFGLWELHGTMLEATSSNDHSEVAVIYGEDDRVLKVARVIEGQRVFSDRLPP